MSATTDIIADLLTRVRNAQSARHKTVDVPASNLKASIAQILVEQGYVIGVEKLEDGKQGILRLSLKYFEGKPAIHGIERVSSPGLRNYVGSDKLPRVKNGLGIAILSTSRGVMTEKEARKQNVGGEVLCRVW